MRTAHVSSLALLFLLACSTFAHPVEAQGAGSARILGRVTSTDGRALADVAVTFASPNLPGIRSASSAGNGDFASPPLPPGRYTLTFEKVGFQTLRLETTLGAGRVETLDALLSPGGGPPVVEERPGGRFSTAITAAETIDHDLLEELPGDRTLRSAVELAAGVHATGPNGALSLLGAQSWESLYLADDVVLNENVRGQPFDLLIEDALDQTTTFSSSIPAELGRFTGGLVNAVTRSGGNRFSGSLRIGLRNDDWQAATPLTVNRRNDTEATLEATFGGPILPDRLWFFVAARSADRNLERRTRILQIPFERQDDDDRFAAKLTFRLGAAHLLQAGYAEVDRRMTNVPHGGLDTFSVTTDDGSHQDRETPQEALAISYSGIVSPRFFAEASYSERQFTFEGSGGRDTSLLGGTPVWDIGAGVIYNESIFCGVCRDEERDNESGRAQASYFLPAAGAGSHDVTFGFETFEDIRIADNHQSATDWMVWNFAGSIFDRANGLAFPVFQPGATLLEWFPILEPSQGTSFVTDAAYVNDRWRLGDRWSLNLGLRYDQNDFVNSLGNGAIDSDRWSPRLGVSFQPAAESPWRLNASYGTYVGLIPNTIGNSGSVAGSPAQFEFIYLGPGINGDGPLLDPVAALGQLFDWFFGQCPRAQVESDPTSCPLLIGRDIPTQTTLPTSGLLTPAADELTAGFSRRLGRGGLLRLDYVRREWSDLFATRRDLSTGLGIGPFGEPFDLGIVVNEDGVLRREADLVNLYYSHSLLSGRLRLGGNYTWMDATGNFDGETSGAGPVASDLLSYPEYREARWNSPDGTLSVGQEHRLRVWAIYDLLRLARHHLNLSLLQSFLSGRPYSAVASIDSRPYVQNPGYVTPPTSVDYFFSRRGEFVTDDVTQTDLGVNYSVQLGRIELFVQPEVLNVFNEDAAIDVDRTVRLLQPFNPFSGTPVEGVHWARGADFGQPVSDEDFQTPRTYRFSVGLRF